MANQATTRDPFGLCLLYYDKYRSAKLQEATFFSKVLKAYRRKPSVMLDKLKDKYSYEIPECVSMSQLQRLISIYPVSQEYVNVVKQGIKEEHGEDALAAFDAAEKYDASMDVHSTSFDAEKAFLNSRDPLYLTRPSGPTKKYDNLAKVKRFVFADHKEFVVPDRSFMDSVKASQKADREREKAQEKKSTIFEDVIAGVLRGEGGKKKAGQATASYGGESSSATAAATTTSPYQLVNDLMREKARAEIIVRHKSGLRGVLTGYVLAADRHMNLLLADVDETAAAYGKKISIKALRQATSIETTPVVRRHFDQVLIRGDNIVLVSKKSH